MTVITVINKLFPKECQKSVTLIASLKLSKLQDAGKDLKLYFSDKGIQKEIEENKSYSSTPEKAHGQIEKREYYQTDDKQAAQNLNIIRKWSLSILKMVEIMKPGLSMRKKRFTIILRPIKY